MIYRLDELSENSINPVTGRKYDGSWIILILTDSRDYRYMCGGNNGCAYTIKLSKALCGDWRMSVGDFIGFNTAREKNMILVMTEDELKSAERGYSGHSFNEPELRRGEPTVLVHSTTKDGWRSIERDGMLKSWNRLKYENKISEEEPIGSKLGDPPDFRDYIMFGGGATGEIVVNSKQSGKIVMDDSAEYVTGARLYFDADKMARDGLLIRDGCHIKAEGALPLEPYMIWAATWESVGLEGEISTPKIFSSYADSKFTDLTGIVI